MLIIKHMRKNFDVLNLSREQCFWKMERGVDGKLLLMSKRKKRLGKLRLAFISLGLFVVAVVLHNAIYAIFGIEEAIFFILALFFLLSFIIFILFSLLEFFQGFFKKD